MSIQPRGGQQPSQTGKKYQKLVRSRPMDLKQVASYNDPATVLSHNTKSTKATTDMHNSYVGASVVQ